MAFPVAPGKVIGSTARRRCWRRATSRVSVTRSAWSGPAISTGSSEPGFPAVCTRYSATLRAAIGWTRMIGTKETGPTRVRALVRPHPFRQRVDGDIAVEVRQPLLAGLPSPIEADFYRARHPVDASEMQVAEEAVNGRSPRSGVAHDGVALAEDRVHVAAAEPAVWLLHPSQVHRTTVPPPGPGSGEPSAPSQAEGTARRNARTVTELPAARPAGDPWETKREATSTPRPSQPVPDDGCRTRWRRPQIAAGDLPWRHSMGACTLDSWSACRPRRLRN